MEHDWQIEFIAVFAVLCPITLVSAAYFIDWELFTTSSRKSSAQFRPTLIADNLFESSYQQFMKALRPLLPISWQH